MKCAANLDPSDEGETFNGGSVVGRGGAADAISDDGVTIITVCLND